jgi:hypothetical protein
MWPHRTYLIDKLCDHITRDIDATSGAESAFLAYLYFDFKDTEKQGPRFVIIPYSALFSPCIPLTKNPDRQLARNVSRGYAHNYKTVAFGTRHTKADIHNESARGRGNERHPEENQGRSA